MAIFTAAVVVGLQTYPKWENSVFLWYIDALIAALFGAEVACKMAAFGFRHYFVGEDCRWNVFDLIVFWGCVASLFSAFSSSGALPVIRLFRLLRVAKLMNSFPQLRMVIMGLLGGLASMGYIVILLGLVMFVFACTGVLAFR
jgi:hypothetical protein